MLKVIVVGIVASFLVSCAGMYAGIIGADQVIVFDSPPDRPFEVITIVYGQDEYIDDAIREIKVKARKMGGDAVILAGNEGTQEEPQTNGNNNQIVQVYQNQNGYRTAENTKLIIKARVIRFK
jgi:hypothetical protein